MNRTVLKLNAAYAPLGLCSWRRAFKHLAAGAVCELESGTHVRTGGGLVAVPSIVRLPHITFLPRRRVNFTRLNVFYRDDLRCQYCGRRGTVQDFQLEHVIPRSRFAAVAAQRGIRWGVTSWQNCVTACEPCNARKGDRLPEEIGMRLLRRPSEPPFRTQFMIGRDLAARRGWLEFLKPFQKFAVMLV